MMSIRLACWLLLVACSVEALQAGDASPAPAVECEGVYAQHLQGVCCGDGSLFWCFTSQLVKTDEQGAITQQVAVEDHHGDLCYHQGKLYVAVNFGRFNDALGKADSWVYVYDAANLSLLERHRVAEVFHGAGGMDHQGGKFMVVGGLPTGVEVNYVYEYDEQFNFIARRELPSGHTRMGIQTAAFADGQWWFGCYGDPAILLRADESLEQVERFEFNGSLGIVPLGNGRFLVARGPRTPDGCKGVLYQAQAREDEGLELLGDASSK